MNLGDIVERDTRSAKPVVAPKPGNVSRFKQRQWKANPAALASRPSAVSDTPQLPRETVKLTTPTAPPASAARSYDPQPPLSEQEKIHLESVKKLSSMSPEEIESEREQLFSTLDPNILQSLLRRAEIKEAQSLDQAEPKNVNNQKNHDSVGEELVATNLQPASTVRNTPVLSEPAPRREDSVEDKPRKVQFDESTKDSAPQLDELPTTVHFPQAPDDLRQYFPDLPVESDKLAWMQPIDDAEEAEYSEELASVAPSELRFDFQGNLVPPRLSRAIDPSEGLHHHGDAPGAAGYTLPELSHLARSTVPSQRSLAIRTAGRVLHKLRQGKFNKSSDLQYGLEQLVTATRIMDTLLEAASDKTRNLTVKTVATEALWLIESTKQ